MYKIVSDLDKDTLEENINKAEKLGWKAVSLTFGYDEELTPKFFALLHKENAV